MTYSAAKIDAYAKLEEAIEALREAHREDDDGKDVLTGWILLTSSIEFMPPDPADPHADDLDTRAASGWYSRRGQDPTLSYGIINEALRHYNEMQSSE